MANTFRPQPLDFITTNPATEAYQAGIAAADKQFKDQLQIEGLMVDNAEKTAGAPTRLRRLNADTNLAETRSDVASRTADFDVSRAGSDASLAGTRASVASRTADSDVSLAQSRAQREAVNAGVDTETAPYRVSQARSGAQSAETEAGVNAETAPWRVQQARTSARSNETEANVNEQTAPTRVAESKTRLRNADATATNTELQSFYKQIELMNAGDIAGAQEIASRTGTSIPPDVLQNKEVLAALTQASKHAQDAYPNRPRDQQAFIQGFIKDMAERRANGGAVNPPEAMYNVTGAPTPPELGNAHQQNPPAEVATAEWLIRNGVAKDANDAWGMVRLARTNPDQAYATVYNSALRATFGDQAKSKTIADDFMKNRPSEQTAAPRPAANASMRPPAGLSGAGTKAAPFVARTQADIEWFKQSAPADAVILINGSPFSK